MSSRDDVITALAAAEGVTAEAAACALDEGRAKVKVDGREFTIRPDGTVWTRPPLSDVVLDWYWAGVPR